MTIKVKVITKASRNTVVAALHPLYQYKIYTTTVPEHGKANEAVLKLMADYLQKAPNELTIISGATNNLKTIAINE